MLFNQMDQIINEATHFPRENIGTCIDLIMTNQPNFFVHSGGLDFLSNGFKIRTTDGSTNASGQTRIFMAFAEESLIGDNPATAR